MLLKFGLIILGILLSSALNVQGFNFNRTLLNERIINGQPSSQPHVVQILNYHGAGTPGQPVLTHGGGSIISSRHILTSAGVLFNFQQIQVGYGSSNLLNLAVIYVTTAVLHPLFNPQTLQNDIGIIILPLSHSWDYSRPVAAIPFSQILLEPAIGQVGTISGFGYTQPNEGFPSIQKQQAQFTVQAPAVCAGHFTATPTHFCAMNAALINVCEGDNGNGMIVATPQGSLLVGIVSIVLPGCTGQWSTGLTRVSSFTAWIQGHL